MDKIEILKYYFGYDSLKEYQSKIIDSILSSKDTIGILPTGYGKSICFTIPSLLLDGVTLVITPLIALMADQVINLKSKYIKAEYISSGMEEYMIDNIYNKLKRNDIKILYIAAERLLNKKFLNTIKSIKISLIVCDEAHTLLWSDDFRQKIKELKSFILGLDYRPKLLALTATATNNTIDKIKDLMTLNNPIIISTNPDRENIYYRIIKTNNKDRELLKYINNHKEKGIIYCLTIKKCLYLYEMLKNLGYLVGIYHGSLESDIKSQMQKDFKNNKIKIMICTNAFGMGIDIPDIRYVIDYDMPMSIEDFSQQTGRASRDNKYAEGVLLFDRNDIKTIEYFIENIDDTNIDYKRLEKIKLEKYKKLDSMIDLIISNKCIHKYIVNYFGFDYNKKCNMCSNCNKK